MEPLLVYPHPVDPRLVEALDWGGYPWQPVGSITDADDFEPDGGWSGAIVCADGDPDGSFELCWALRRDREIPVEPLLLVVRPDQLGDLELREHLFDDLILTPLRYEECMVRIRHAFWRTGTGTRPELIEHGPLTMNVETHQAAIAGRELHLTHMEYELLKFLATHPGKVFTRHVLVDRVWGYDYDGSPRTVDIHVRRLRAWFEEHADLIETVRGVGYRLGRSRWELMYHRGDRPQVNPSVNLVETA